MQILAGPLDESRQDLEALGVGDVEATRAVLESLTAELGRALGPRGRARRTGSDAERARVNVQRRVRDAIRRIGDNDPALARHLTRSIRTGTVCRYEPE